MLLFGLLPILAEPHANVANVLHHQYPPAAAPSLKQKYRLAPLIIIFSLSGIAMHTAAGGQIYEGTRAKAGLPGISGPSDGHVDTMNGPCVIAK